MSATSSYKWHHLVNAYEGKEGMVYLQVKLSDDVIHVSVL